MKPVTKYIFSSLTIEYALVVLFFLYMLSWDSEKSKDNLFVFYAMIVPVLTTFILGYFAGEKIPFDETKSLERFFLFVSVLFSVFWLGNLFGIALLYAFSPEASGDGWFYSFVLLLFASIPLLIIGSITGIIVSKMNMDKGK